jgi:two-component system, cell cycle response regulator
MARPRPSESPADVTIVHDAAAFQHPKGEARATSLVVIYGEFLGRRFEISDAPLTIGRSPECSIQLADDSASRQHCRVSPGEDGVVLVDLNSTNGTYVNGTAVSARHLRDGDRVQVGRTIFKFLMGSNIEQAYHEEIYRLKTTDGLTGAVNKRSFDEEMQREFHRFLRYGRPLVLVMLDIDLFKKVNDTYGHLAGDRVLSELGRLICGAVRSEDTFSRYGGEEFALLLPETELADGIRFTERLRSDIAAARFEFDGMTIPVTISGGVADATADMAGPERFVALADERLYAAKRNGRNRIEPKPED